jgi:hypothetical protein
LEKGFTTYWPSDTSLSPTKRDFLLLSHIVFSIHKRGAKLNKQITSVVTADVPSDHNLPVTKKFEDTSPSPPSVTTTNPSSVISLNSPIEKFDLNKATLIMTVRRHGTFKGSVHIKLSPSCNSQFIQKLGKICFRTPKQFSNLIEKVSQIVATLKYFPFHNACCRLNFRPFRACFCLSQRSRTWQTSPMMTCLAYR